MSSVVGVDLGLQNSVIAAAGRGGVDVVLNGNSQRLNPSMVAFAEARKMGEQAGTGAISQYKNTIKNMKRFVGLAFDDPRAQAEMKRVPFKCVPIEHKGKTSTIGVQVNYNGEETVVPVEQVCGNMLHHLGMVAAQKAAASTGNADHKTAAQLFPQDWVIAIPPYFDDSQRRGVLTGCEIVGITGVLRLINEHTAVALGYGMFKDLRKEFTKESPTNIMFIDMGASSYTVSIATFEPAKLIVKSCYFDANLGGRDFDQVIAEWISAKFVEKYGSKLSGNPMERPKVVLKMLAAAEKAKKTLSPHGVKEASINLECLMDDLDFHITLKAEEYEKLSKPLLDRLEAPIKAALEEAKMTTSDLAAVEIIGGSTRIGCLKRRLEAILGGANLSTTMNADEAVARGAALQSAVLSARFRSMPYEIVEAQAYPISISWDEEGDGGVEVEGDADGSDMPSNSVVMFDRGLNFPITRRVTIRRSGPFVVKASYDAAATKYGFVGASSDVASFAIQLPPCDNKKVRVNVKQDIHGIIDLSSAQMIDEVEEEESEKKEEEQKEGATEEKKKKIKRTNLDFTVSRNIEWTRDEIVKANEMEVAMANNDRVIQETADMRNELESYIYDMRDKISSESQLGAYASESEKEAFLKKNDELENWLYEDGFDATKKVYAEKLAELKTFGGPIEIRAAEAAGRGTAVSALQANIEKYKTWLASAQGDEKYAHITEEEFNKCHAKCDETSNWVYGMLDKQGALPASADPAFTISQVNAKSKELTETCSPIMFKPAPKKETKKEEPKKDDAKTEEKPASDENGDAMDVEKEEAPAKETNPADMDVE